MSNIPQGSAKMGDPKKLASFLQECLVVGCLKGFKHFEVYLRGKEELLVRVYNTSSGIEGTGSFDTIQKSNALSGSPAPARLFLSQRMKKSLFDVQLNAAPASPCDQEMEKDETKTAFLVAGYARYGHPYVWLRSNHQRLMKRHLVEVTAGNDDPLKLESVKNWVSNPEMKLWAFLDEIVSLSTFDSLKNPFAVDHEYFNQVPLEQSFIQSAALIRFLYRVHVGNTKYKDLVWEDIKQLQYRHFNELKFMMKQQLPQKQPNHQQRPFISQKQ